MSKIYTDDELRMLEAIEKEIEPLRDWIKDNKKNGKQRGFGGEKQRTVSEAERIQQHT